MIELDESQRAALALVKHEPISIVTGGPGTGKSTIVRAMLDAMDAGVLVGLAAPTGKAAKRLEETTGRNAQTIHRLLKYSPAEKGFFHCAAEPLPHDVIVIDEASMVDVSLCASLLEAIDPTRTRVVLVGDADQLPSVGPGSILSDLVRSGLVPCARLETVHRSKVGSWICTAAPRVLAGQSINLDARNDFAFVPVDSADWIPRACGDAYEKHGAQILTPQRTGKAGTVAINKALQERFNPLQPGEKQWGDLRPRDRVIHTRNNYDLGVFNGETGTVRGIDSEAGALFVDYPDRVGPVRYSRAESWDLSLAYALTVHKAQGSEWPWVIVVAHHTHAFMNTRRLIYTAITRAKAGAVIVGSERGIDQAIASKRDVRRNTALAARIRGDL